MNKSFLENKVGKNLFRSGFLQEKQKKIKVRSISCKLCTVVTRLLCLLAEKAFLFAAPVYMCSFKIV